MKTVDFKKIIRYFKSRGGHREQEDQSFVVRDWKIILSASVLLLFLVSMAGGFLYWKYHQGLIVEGPELIKKSKKIDQVSLKEALEEIDAKAIRFNDVIEAPELTDPSRPYVQSREEE